MHIFIISDTPSVSNNLQKHLSALADIIVLDIDALQFSPSEDIEKGIIILNTLKALDQDWLEDLHRLFFRFPMIALLSKDQMSKINMPYTYPLSTPCNLSDLFSLIYNLDQKMHMTSIGPFSFYPITKILKNRNTGSVSVLTEKESDVLEYLKTNHPRAISRDELLKEIWEYAPDLETHTLETHLYRLRKKLETGDGRDLLITQDTKYVLKLN